MTGFDGEKFVEIGSGDVKRIYRLCNHVDKLISSKSKLKGRKNKYQRQKLQHKIDRMLTRIRNLIDEVHNKTAVWLTTVLLDATNDYFQRKAASQTKPNGETILVVTDGEPDDRKAVMKVIIEASRRLDRDEELAISFIQVGTDAQATRFLKVLDDELQSAGAKFDIVDTVTIDNMEDMTLSEVLLNAIID